MILPIIGGVIALGTGSVVCYRGVTTESGTAPGGDWRIRWACWRWIAEMRKRDAAGNVGDWSRMGTYGMGKKQSAIMAAKALVILPPGSTSAMASALVKIKRASFQDQ